jgi:hypothetical protein
MVGAMAVATALVGALAAGTTSVHAATASDGPERPDLEVGGDLPQLDEQAGLRPTTPTTDEDEETTSTTEEKSNADDPRDQAEEDEDEGGTDRTSTTETTEPAEQDDVTPVSESDDAGSDDDGKGGALVLGLLVGLLGGAAVGAGAMALLRRGSSTSVPVAAVPAVATPGDGQRAALVAAVIEVRDSVPSEALRERLGRALQDVGVRELTVEPGQPFDPQWHRAVDTTPTADPAQVNTVATTERPGYVDGATTLRLPEVIVYRPQ